MNDMKSVLEEKLSTVLDPETGVDVIRMGLVESLEVTKQGIATYKIRPSSMFCPLAVPLSMAIINAIKDIAAIKGQLVEVVGYMHENELNHMLKEYLEEVYGSQT